MARRERPRTRAGASAGAADTTAPERAQAAQALTLILLRLAGLLLALVACGSPAAPVALSEPPVVEVGVPIEVEIPSIGAKSTLIVTGLNPDGALEVPPDDNPMQASWWDGSPRPGEAGPAVILGHVDGAIDGVEGRPGIFHRLHELNPGDKVLVTTDDGAMAEFEVLLREQVDKDAFPTQRVYGNTLGPELRLITCGGVFDRGVGHYEDNVVVYLRGAA